MDRRTFLLSGAAVAGAASVAHAQVLAQHGAHMPPLPPAPQPYARLRPNGAPMDHLMPGEGAQRVDGSPAPQGPMGRWTTRASLPIARSEMAWATALAGKLHIVGGYGEGRVDRTYHHVYDPAADQWYQGAPLPRGANHVAVVADGNRVYAFGGFIEQNRNPIADVYAYEAPADRWTQLAPLPRPRGAAGAVVIGGQIHLIGGAAAPTAERASIGWHEVYDPQKDSWSMRKALPGARDHVGIAAYGGAIHVIGGRFNTFEYNTDLHHVYLPQRDTWEPRAVMPTARSGHGLVVYRDRLFAMGGEHGVFVGSELTQPKVFAQMESYDPKTDTWQQHAPMITARHAVGAATIGDAIYVAGGGAITGGGVQSAIHEAFTLN